MDRTATGAEGAQASGSAAKAARGDAPHIERTHFDPIEPPRELTLWFCPACGQRITSHYNLDTARKRCTKTWHLTMPVAQKYKAV